MIRTSQSTTPIPISTFRPERSRFKLKLLVSNPELLAGYTALQMQWYQDVSERLFISNNLLLQNSPNTSITMASFVEHSNTSPIDATSKSRIPARPALSDTPFSLSN